MFEALFKLQNFFYFLESSSNECCLHTTAVKGTLAK